MTGSDHDENSMYTDLIGFLKSSRQDLRLASAQAVMAVKDLEGMSKLVKHGAAYPLNRLSSQPGVVGIYSLTSLVKLSSQGPSASQCVEDLIEAGALSRMTEICLSRFEKEQESEESWKKRVNFAMALLVNITRTEQGAVDLVGRTLPEEAVTKEETGDEEGNDHKLPTKPTLELLLSRFLSSQYVEETPETVDGNNESDADNSHYDPFQHFASVLMNATQLQAGRKFVLRIHREQNGEDKKKTSTSSVLQAILAQLRVTNTIRRRGIAGTLKNCCLEKDTSWWLLEEIKLTKHLLYPLAGPEELDVDDKRGLDPDLWLEGPDKEREPDALTRLFLIESILLLCTAGRKARESLRLSRVYVVLKWADMVEEREDVSERINECVQYMRRDEQGTDEGSSDKAVWEALGEEKMLALPAPSASQEVGSPEDYDDVD